MTLLPRRTFLAAAPLGLVTILSPSFPRAAASPAKTLRKGFGTYGLPGWSLLDSIEGVARAGFDSIELAAMPGYHADPDALSPAERREARKQIESKGLVLGALMGLPTPGAESKGKQTDRVRRMIELSLDLSPKAPAMIQSVLGGGRWEEKKGLYAETLQGWSDLLGDSGVRLAIKPHRGHAMSRPEQAVWLIESTDLQGRVGLVYDYSHYAFRDMTPEETVKVAAPHTFYVVMKDTRQTEKGIRFDLPGATNGMPHAEVLRRFYTAGYRGEVCCEVSSQVWKAPGYDAKKALELCLSGMSKAFREAGLS